MVRTGFSLTTSSLTNSDRGLNSSATYLKGSGPSGTGPLAVIVYGLTAAAACGTSGSLTNLSTAGVKSAGGIIVAVMNTLRPLGKPAQADMELGLSTAPVLFAAQEVEEIRPLIMRRFKEEGDVKKAVELSQETDCIAKSYHLAEFHAQKAIDALDKLPESEAKGGLMRLLHTTLSRTN